MFIESVMPSNHLILSDPLLLPPSIFPSIRVFSNESVLCIRWSKYWSFSYSISPSNEYSGLISFRMDWLDHFFQLLAAAGIHGLWLHQVNHCLPSHIAFSSFPQSFPLSGSFQMSQFFTSGGQSTGASASPLILPMNIQD